MTFVSYKEFISKIHNSVFSLKENYRLSNIDFDLVGYNKFTLGRTFITQNHIVDRYDSHEYILLKYFSNLSYDNLILFLNSLHNLPKNIVNIDKYHKSTYITCILAVDNLLDKKSINAIKKFKQESVYKFYLRGFSEIRLLVVNLNSNEIISNKSGKSIKKMYSLAS